MMEAVREWLTSVVVVTLLISVAQGMIPEGGVRKIAGFTGGLILLVTLLQPVLKTDLGGLRLHFEDYEAAVAERQAELEADQDQALADIIAERTEAYILDKASELGLEISLRVETETDQEGIPIPAAVEIEGPRSEELAAYLEEELGIPAERQVWHGQEDQS